MNQLSQPSWLLVVLSACCNGIGTALLKQSRLASDNSSLLENIFSVWFISALVVYSTGLLVYTKALERLPISAAVPASQGITFILVTFISYWWFDERLTFNQIVATGFIFAGLVAMTR